MQLKKYIILCAALYSAIALLQPSAAFTEEQNSGSAETAKINSNIPATEPPKQPPPRPSQILDLSYTALPQSGTEESKIGMTSFLESSSVINNLRAEKYSADSQKLPDHLYRITETFSARWSNYIIMVSGGSSSDKPFSSSRAIAAVGSAGIKITSEGENALFAGIFYSKEKIFHYRYNFPFPFFTYFFKNDSVSGSLGFPTMISWKISRELSLNASYFPVFNSDLSLNYRPLPFITIGPAVSWRIHGYRLSSEQDDEFKFYHEQIRLLFKVQSYVARNVGVYISGGYSIRERYFRGISSMNAETVVKNSTSWIIQAGVQGFLY